MGIKMKKIIFSILVVLVIFIAIDAGIYFKNNGESEKVNSNVFYEPEYNTDYITEVNNIELTNDEVKNKYQFVFVSDLQASIINENEPDEQIRNSLAERNTVFYLTNDNTKVENIFKEAINYTNNKNANALLLGGDIIDSPADSNFQFLRENLNNLKVPYLYALGNHDWSFAWDYHTKNAEEQQYPKFTEFMDDVQVSYLEYEDLIILAINDSKDQIDEEALSKIKMVLEKQKPTIVMMHVPIATEYIAEEAMRIRNRVSAIGEDGVKPNDTTQKAIDMILSDEYKVFHILAGHVHFDMNDSINERINENICSPAYAGEISVIKINN
jgi:Icc-related predicted phosphoesterase